MLISCFWLWRVEVWDLTLPRIIGIKGLPDSGRKTPFQLHCLQSWTEAYEQKGQGVQCLQAHLQHPALWSCRKCLEKLRPASLQKPKKAGMGWSCSFPPQALLGDAREQPGITDNRSVFNSHHLMILRISPGMTRSPPRSAPSCPIP